MTEHLAQKLALHLIHKSGDNSFSVSILKYSLSILLNLIFGVALTLMFGYALGQPYKSFQVLLIFSILRFFTGGFHFKSLDICAIVSGILFSLIPLIPPLTNTSIIAITMISLVIVLIKVPISVNHQKFTKKRRYIYQTIATVLVILNLVYLSQLYALSIFAQSLTLTLKQGGE